MNTKPLLLILFFLLTLSFSAHGRFITSVTSSSDLLSDGIHSVISKHSLVQVGSNTSDETCEETYGFLPCTTTVLGNLFLAITYGYLMFLAARYLSTGSELLLEILGPGIVGGLFLPALGALPDAMLILVSGLSGSKETAQKQVLVGMGLLAGSTVMLLTILWGSCVIVGKTDIEDSKTKDMTDTKRFSLTGSGISTDSSTSYAARIMTISVIPFIIVQLPQIFHTSSGKRIAILISLIVAVAMLLSYCLFQVFQPWIQKRRLAYVKHKHIISGLLKHLKKHALGRLITESGDPDKDVLEKMFVAIDLDNNTYLSRSELRAFVIGIRFEEIDLGHEEAVQKLLSDFDVNEDGKLDKAEFFKGVSKWVYEARRSYKPTRTSDPGAHTFVERFHLQTKQDYDELVADQSDEIMEVENVKWVSLKAGLLLLLGTAIAAAFADPLVDAVDNFSTATSIPTFFISFIALPLATNSSEAVSALIFASRKKKTMFSLTFSEIYGAVTMNNLLCLAVFLALVYVRGLTWDFSAEVLVILIVCILMGLLASFRTIFPLWMSSLAYVLYPLSLVLVYVLDNVFGWS